MVPLMVVQVGNKPSAAELNRVVGQYVLKNGMT